MRLTLRSFGFWMVMIFLAFGLYKLSPQITGFVTSEFTYSEDLSLVVTTNSSYQWTPANEGELLSLLLDGSLTNNGSAKVYLESNNQRTLVFDSSRLDESQQEEELNITGTSLADITALITRIALKNVFFVEQGLQRCFQ